MPGQDVTGLSPLPKTLMEMDLGEAVKTVEKYEEERKQEIANEIEANLRQEMERYGRIKRGEEKKDEVV